MMSMAIPTTKKGQTMTAHNLTAKAAAAKAMKAAALQAAAVPTDAGTLGEALKLDAEAASAATANAAAVDPSATPGTTAAATADALKLDAEAVSAATANAAAVEAVGAAAGASQSPSSLPMQGRRWDGSKFVPCTMEEQDKQQAALAKEAERLNAAAASVGESLRADDGVDAALFAMIGEHLGGIRLVLDAQLDLMRKSETRRDKIVEKADGLAAMLDAALSPAPLVSARVVAASPEQADDLSKRVPDAGSAPWKNRSVRVYGWFHTRMSGSAMPPWYEVCDLASVVDPWVFMRDARRPELGIAPKLRSSYNDHNNPRGDYGGPFIVNHEHEITPGGLMQETVSIVDRIRAEYPERRVGVYGVPCGFLYENQINNVQRWNAERKAAGLFQRVDFLCINAYWDDGMTLDRANGGGGVYELFCDRAAAVAESMGKPMVLCISHRTALGTLVPAFEFMLSAIERAFRRVSHLLEGVAFFVGNDDKGEPDRWDVALPYAKLARAWADRLSAEAGPIPTFATAAANPGPQS